METLYWQRTEYDKDEEEKVSKDSSMDTYFLVYLPLMSKPLLTFY